ncbi:MAG: hypothetical protein Q8P32_03805 [Candidatus Komeilibacteria bacterium]|nr:hypothetical protein [Candidatus Komeilibacteria bacterium]
MLLYDLIYWLYRYISANNRQEFNQNAYGLREISSTDGRAKKALLAE